MDGLPEVIIVGAGAAGLMCAYTLAKSGKRVLILEARDRVGGRIWQVEEGFGFPIQAGGEFVHGDSAVTHALAQEAGLTYVPMDTEIWRFTDGAFIKGEVETPFQAEVSEILKNLKEDMPIQTFLDTYFAEETYKELREFVLDMAGSYDAADPKRASTFAIKEAWLGGGEWKQGKIKEGYGALVSFLESQCRDMGVEMLFNQEVKHVEVGVHDVTVGCADGKAYAAQKAVITVPLPLLNSIHFKPDLPDKMAAAAHIGFGGAIKINFLFKDRWWADAMASDPKKTVFILSDEAIPTWWSHYPEPWPRLVGWVAGPQAERLKDHSTEAIIDLGLISLAAIFNIKKEVLQEKVVTVNVANWITDPLALGAYSYATPETAAAVAELRKPVDNKLFFAGEALDLGHGASTVDGALASGKQTAEAILGVI